MSETSARMEDRSTLERVLGVVTEVHAGEGANALLMTLNVFLLLMAYYVIKPVREGLILSMENGAQYKAYMSGAIAIGLLVAVPLYGKAADRLAKNRLVIGVTLFFATHLVLFYVLSKTGLESKLGLAFFMWVGIFNMMVVAQFWAFANDVYSESEGKRLFPLLGIGAAAGGAVGAYGTTVLVKMVGTFQLMLVSAAVLVGSAALTFVSARRLARAHHDGEDAHERALTPHAKKKDAHAKGGAGTMKEASAAGSSGQKNESGAVKESGTFALVFRHKYLVLIAVFSLVFTFVNTNGEYMLGALVIRKAKALGEAGPDFKTGFFADFFLWVNIAVLVLQTFVVSRIVKFGGLKVAFFILPVIALLDATGLLLLGSLTIVRIGKIAENATDYSLNNTVRNMLWLPTTTDMKYKAKQAVDTFMVRMGDVANGLLVFVIDKALKLEGGGVRAVAIVNMLLVGVWIFIAIGIVRENARLTRERERENEGVPAGAAAAAS